MWFICNVWVCPQDGGNSFWRCEEKLWLQIVVTCRISFIQLPFTHECCQMGRFLLCMCFCINRKWSSIYFLVRSCISGFFFFSLFLGCSTHYREPTSLAMADTSVRLLKWQDWTSSLVHSLSLSLLLFQINTSSHLTTQSVVPCCSLLAGRRTDDP